MHPEIYILVHLIDFLLRANYNVIFEIRYCNSVGRSLLAVESHPIRQSWKRSILVLDYDPARDYFLYTGFCQH